MALQHRLLNSPSQKDLTDFWNQQSTYFSGLRRKFICNSARNSHAPRLTLSENIKSEWYLRAEVSIPAWLFKMNTKLPNQADIALFLQNLPGYISEKTQLTFDAFSASVRRVDFTQDFPIGRNKIIQTIKSLYKVHPPRFQRVIYNEETVEFSRKGKSKGFVIKVYDKLAELISHKKTIENQIYIKNLLRLEVSYLTPYYIKKIKEAHNLSSITAEHILRIDLAESEILKAKNLIHFDDQVSTEVNQLDILIANYDTRYAATLYGFLKLIEDYGFNFHELSSLNYPKRTYRKHLADCKAAGISHYE